MGLLIVFGYVYEIRSGVIIFKGWRNLRDVVTKVLNCVLELSKFKIHSFNFVYF